MKKILLFSWVPLLLIMGASAHAQGKSEGGKSASTGRFEAYMSTGYIGLVKDASSIDIAPGFEYGPIPGWTWLQVGGELMYQRLSYQGGTTKSWVAVLGPTLNFGPANSDSTFVSVGLGIRGGSSDYADPSAQNPGGVGYYFIVGKRISIGGGWSLRPTAGIMSAGTGGLVIRPFALSLFF